MYVHTGVCKKCTPRRGMTYSSRRWWRAQQYANCPYQ